MTVLLGYSTSLAVGGDLAEDELDEYCSQQK